MMIQSIILRSVSEIIKLSSNLMFFILLESPHQLNSSDCIVLSSEDESEVEENDVFQPNVNDGAYWDDIARITYGLFSDFHNPDENGNRKRSHSSTSSLLSDDDQRRKRTKQSRTDAIELITLSSSDNSDNDDQ